MRTRWFFAVCAILVPGLLFWRGTQLTDEVSAPETPELGAAEERTVAVQDDPQAVSQPVGGFAPLRDRPKPTGTVAQAATPVVPSVTQPVVQSFSAPLQPLITITTIEPPVLSSRSLEGGSINPETGQPERAIVGIGAVLVTEEGSLRVREVLPNSPAAEANLAGCVIEAINGVPIGEIPLAEAVRQIRGVEGSSVKLDVVRPSGDRQTVEVVRRTVRLQQ